VTVTAPAVTTIAGGVEVIGWPLIVAPMVLTPLKVAVNVAV